MPIELDPHRPSLPPAEVVEVKAIRNAIEAYNAARHAAHVADREATALEQAHPQAVEKDRHLYAAAITKDKGDPGTPNTDAHDEQLNAARRHAAARKLVEEQAFDALRKAFDQHGPEWGDVAEQRLDTTRHEYDEAIDMLAEKHAALAQAESVAAFALGNSRRFSERSGGSVPMRRTNSDHRVAVGDLLNALRTLTVSPEPHRHETHESLLGAPEPDRRLPSQSGAPKAITSARSAASETP